MQRFGLLDAIRLILGDVIKMYHKVKWSEVAQSCLTPWDHMDCSPPGSPVPGILQPRTLEWVAISFFNAWKWKVKVKSLNRVWLLETLWTATYQGPPSMGFARQEYWSGLPFSSPGDLSNPGIEPGSPTLQADALLSEPPGNPKMSHDCT